MKLSHTSFLIATFTVAIAAVLYVVPSQAVSKGNVYPLAMCSNVNIYSNPLYAPKILEAGARMVRIDFSFRSIRPNEGTDTSKWNWQELDKARALRSQYPQLDWLVLFGYGAEWAQDPKFAKFPGDPAAGGEKGAKHHAC